MKDDNIRTDTVSFIVIASTVWYTSDGAKCKPAKLISEKDRIRIVNTSFKVKWQVLAMELVTRAFPTHFFLGISKITVLPNSSKWRVLKNYTVKLIYQRLRKCLKIRRKNLHMLYRMGLLSKRLKSFVENLDVGVLL